MTIFFAVLALAVLIGLAIFQFALIAGAPIGTFAWGGANRVLPTKFRIASVISIILYALFGVFIANKAGLIDLVSDERVVTIGMWIFTVYFFIGIIMNAISRSKPERNLMTPIAAVLAVSFLVVTLAR